MEKFILCLKLTWMRRIVTKSNKYLTTVTNVFPILNNCLKYGSKYINDRRFYINNLFWRAILNGYKCFIEKNKPSSMSEIFSIPLWFNMNIKVGGAAVHYKNWENKGIVFINDLMDTNGDFLPFEIFCRNYSLQTHLLLYEGFVKSIRNYIVESTVENESKEKISGPVCSVYCSLILKNKKGCRHIYDKFILNDVTPTSLAK